MVPVSKQKYGTSIKTKKYGTGTQKQKGGTGIQTKPVPGSKQCDGT
jgi:hypothetical protein